MAMPTVVSAQYENVYRIRLAFADGTVKTVDFRAWLKGPVFEPLKETSYFRRFFIEGGTVGWPNGADIAPETLYEARPVKTPARRAVQRTSGAVRRRSAARR